MSGQQRLAREIGSLLSLARIAMSMLSFRTITRLDYQVTDGRVTRVRRFWELVKALKGLGSGPEGLIRDVPRRRALR